MLTLSEYNREPEKLLASQNLASEEHADGQMDKTFALFYTL